MKTISARLILLFFTASTHALPSDFVYLHDVAPSIVEDMRYASTNNFTGKPIPGYRNARCILTREAALKLAKVNQQAEKMGYRLKVYDCYRPQQAVDAFYRWSMNLSDTTTKAGFYPREPKNTLFERGYIAKASGHTRGSTVDLTLVPLNSATGAHTEISLTRCYGKSLAYLTDNSINTGTRFDCLDPSAAVFYSGTTPAQKKNRMLLRNMMVKNGFKPYNKEWWHFTLSTEPFPNTYFNFPVR